MPKLNFNHLRSTDEIFWISKYEEKIKFDKIWGIIMVGPFKRERQNLNFLIIIKIWGYTSKYKGKIKFDKIWGTKMGGSFKIWTF